MRCCMVRNGCVGVLEFELWFVSVVVFIYFDVVVEGLFEVILVILEVVRG